MTAWIALIIAAGALGWNVVSTVYSWRQSHIKIEITIQVEDQFVSDDIGHIVRLIITALNRGVVSAAITGVGVVLDERSGWGYEFSPTRSIGPFGIVGPQVPATVERNHEVAWSLDLAFVAGNSLYEKDRIIVPYVQVSGGKVIQKPYQLSEDERERALEIFKLRHEHHREGAIPPSDETKQNCPYCQLQAKSAWLPTIAAVGLSDTLLLRPKPRSQKGKKADSPNTLESGE